MKFLLSLATVLLLPMAANAHVVASPDSGPANNYFQTSFRVSHGCDGSATVAVHVKIPAEILSVHPQFKPGWKVKIISRKSDHAMADHAMAGHGMAASEEVDEVIWRGGPLPSDEYDEFGLLMKLPDDAGKTLWFPVTQECEKGKAAWDQIPAEGQAWHDVKSPAPFVRVKAASAE